MSNKDETFLIVGLGNPGPKYIHTRHNIGFEIVDALALRLGKLSFSKKFQGLWAQTEKDGLKVHLLKPQTYMNLSGQSVQEILHFFKILPQTQLLLVADDLDLPPAQLRLRLLGGSGGHNGLKSIIEHLGNEDFARLRVGIGRPEGEDYVLSRFSNEEKPLFEEAINRACVGIEAILKDGLQKAMNVINVKRGTNES